MSGVRFVWQGVSRSSASSEYAIMTFIKCTLDKDKW